LIFGDKSTTQQYANNPAIQIHGPGYSKILIADDEVQRWPEFIDVIVSAISDNGGRSCINASTVIVPRYAAEIADALAKKLGPIAPTAPEDENARLSGFANVKMADYIDGAIEEGLQTAGATEVTNKYRNGHAIHSRVEADRQIAPPPRVSAHASFPSQGWCETLACWNPWASIASTQAIQRF
jgi:acyl-CoA reductase-like NAD-dependent aldehyde dehydrogenase